MRKFLILATAFLGGCTAMGGGGGGWTAEDAGSQKLEFCESYARYFTAHDSIDVRVGYTVQGGTASVFLMSWDDYLVAKANDGAYRRAPSIHQAPDSHGGDFTAPVTPGKWAIVFSNQTAGNGQDIDVSWNVFSASRGTWGDANRAVEYNAGSMCPSCLSATCHKVHPMCTKCQGRGSVWSEIQKLETTCDFCHGTGRSDY